MKFVRDFYDGFKICLVRTVWGKRILKWKIYHIRLRDLSIRIKLKSINCAAWRACHAKKRTKKNAAHKSRWPEMRMEFSIIEK